jgi:hypothetical protein
LATLETLLSAFKRARLGQSFFDPIVEVIVIAVVRLFKSIVAVASAVGAHVDEARLWGSVFEVGNPPELKGLIVIKQVEVFFFMLALIGRLRLFDSLRHFQIELLQPSDFVLKHVIPP